MALLTLRILDGPDRGNRYDSLPTPVTIGREEGNVVQLTDDRVSRFHLKIQEDDDRLVMTDLESTNGTKVNGEAVQLWILHPGDVISIGRTQFLVGTPEEIARRLASLRGIDLSQAMLMGEEDEKVLEAASISFESEIFADDASQALSTLHALLPPELPDELTTRQAAQLSELLLYFHLRLSPLIESVRSVDDEPGTRITLVQRHWQNLLDLYERLGYYLRHIGEPER